MDATPTPGLSSLGNLAGQLQTPVAGLSALINELGLRPGLKLNDVPYFSDADAEKIAERVRQKNQTTTR